MVAKKQFWKVLLLILSVIDLVFGILSFVFEPIEWQICSLIASTMTFVCLLVLILRYRDEAKSNITTIIFSIADIATGIMSIVLVVFALKAIVVTISVMKSLKVGKVVIQGEKALKLSKTTAPFAKRLVVRALPIIFSFVKKEFKKNRGIKMEVKDEKKKNGFFKFIKNNWQTILGFFALAYIVIEAVFGFISKALVSVNIDGLWSQLIMSPLYALAVNGLVKSGLEFGKSKQVRELAKTIGVDGVYDKLTEMYDEKIAEEEAQKEAEEKRKKLLEKLVEIEADEVRQKEEQERQQEELIKQNEIEQAERELTMEATLIAEQYKNAVIAGTFTGTLAEYYEALSK